MDKQEALDKEFARRESHIEKMRQKKIAGDDKFGDQVTDRTAPALRAGSVEAYKFLLAQRDSLAEKQARQEELAEEANTIAREQLDELRQQPRFAARGGK
jgi:predicted  nucleic acid-binding Zn-ribbon protein